MWYPMALPPFLSSPVSLATVWQGTSRSHVSLMHHGILSSQLVVSEYQFNQSPHSDYVTRVYVLSREVITVGSLQFNMRHSTIKINEHA